MVPEVLAPTNVVVKFLNQQQGASRFSRAVDVRLQIARRSSNGEETSPRSNCNGPLCSSANKGAGDCGSDVR